MAESFRTKTGFFKVRQDLKPKFKEEKNTGCGADNPQNLDNW